MTANVNLRTTSQGRRQVDGPFAFVAIVSALFFCSLWLTVVLLPGPLFFDRPTAIAIQNAYPAALAPFDDLIAWLGGTTETIAGILFVLIVCVLVRRARRLVIFAALYALIYEGVNFLVQRPRPTGLPRVFQHIGAYSFPSGHIAFVIFVCTVTVIVFARKLPQPLYIVAWLIALTVIVFAALSRIAVGAHWPSDVLAGVLVGAGWISLSLSIHWLTCPLFGDQRPSEFVFHSQRTS